MSLLSAATLLFLVLDPVGNVPMFLKALEFTRPERQQRVIARELLIALVIMVAALFLGRWVFVVLKVGAEALMTAGGVLLLLIAIRMIFPTPLRNREEPVTREPRIVPLAVPYTAGPSVIIFEILLMSQWPGQWLTWLGGVVLAWLGAAVILWFSAPLQRRLGRRTLEAAERLMGMILVLVAMQMLLGGLKSFFGIGA
ncbi:MAG: MarC family protein [Micrococcales bacterium]|nr:MarC family protein [Micrococcales bacterium]